MLGGDCAHHGVVDDDFEVGPLEVVGAAGVAQGRVRGDVDAEGGAVLQQLFLRKKWVHFHLIDGRDESHAVQQLQLRNRKIMSI